MSATSDSISINIDPDISSLIYNSQEDKAFEDRLNVELSKIVKYESNSPLSMSASNTDDDDEDDNNSSITIRRPRFKKISIKDVEDAMNRYYNTDKSIGEMDTLVAHIKCQKILYIEAKNHTQFCLNILMIPSVLIATLITVLAPFVTTISHGSYIITAMNATTTLLITLINHLKLETYAKNYELIAIRYAKLHSSLELFSTKMLFSTDNMKLKEVLKNVEEKLTEIKEQNDMLLPENVKRKYPIISNINIFSTIHAIEMHRKNLMMQLTSVKNEIRYIYAKWNTESKKCLKEETRLNFLIETKDKMKKELMKHFNAFSYINEIFELELEQKSCRWLAKPPTIDPESIKLIKFI
jgi:hypothetical protein